MVVETGRRSIPPQESPAEKLNPLDQLLGVITEHFELEPDEIFKPRSPRNPNTRIGRALTIYFLYQSGIDTATIAQFLDTTETVVKRIPEKVGSLKKKYPGFGETIERLGLNIQIIRERDNTAKIKNQVLNTVSEEFDLPVEHIIGDHRFLSYMQGRFSAMHLLREAGLPLKTVGFVLGGRDHSTVFHGLGEIQRHIETWPDFEERIHRMSSRIDAIRVRRELEEEVKRRINNKEQD